MRAPSVPMASLATLVAVATVATLAALAVADDAKNSLPQYVSTLFKGSLGSELEETLGPFYIPDGQCSGVLDDLLSCMSGAVPDGVRIAVRDSARFPLVALHDSLRRASVLRAQPCQGEATVTMRLSCADTPDAPDTSSVS